MAPADRPRSPHPSRPSATGALQFGRRAVLVPVKDFRQAKGRLDPALNGPARAALARTMADRVLAAAAPLPVAVVCDDNEVADWARSRGALVVWEPGRGLNGAVEAGVDRLRAGGVEQVTVAHADLPRASSLASVGDRHGITLVADRFGNGTNVIVVPTDAGFRFSYGPGSFARHVAEGHRSGLQVHVLERPDLAWDVDVPTDLVTPDGTLPLGADHLAPADGLAR